MSYSSRLRERESFATGKGRTPFFQLVEKYLPEDSEAVVVDLGAGRGEFFDLLKVHERFPNAVALDGNPKTVVHLTDKGHPARHYQVPDKMPVADQGCALLHCSHLVEHLTPDVLHLLMIEMDRVLAPNGVLVISAPLLNESFYGDMSHIKPYTWDVFCNYFGVHRGGQRARDLVTTMPYEKLELRMRYAKERPDSLGWGGQNAPIDLVLKLAVRLLSVLGVRRYSVNGFTLVLRKGA